NEADITFTISQIEVESTEEILVRKDEFLQELEIERRSRDAVFCAIMITDVIKLTSYMMIVGKNEFMQVLDLPPKGPGVFFLRGIVSRKKQLVPLLTEQVEKLQTAG
ncbi:MAG: inorganic diphosphatase, partial [Treponema sp.]|nr:inorganic diphosphatase [Treponema sp.]